MSARADTATYREAVAPLLSIPPDWIASVFRVGSHSHGTHVPTSDPTGVDDTDFMAIIVPSQAGTYGLNPFEHAATQRDGVDVVAYSWAKYIRLLLKGNPNVIGTLWLDREDMEHSGASPVPTARDYRDVFASKRVYHSFVGYALAQFHKMTHHAHQGYMGAKRKALVEQFGYDVKNAAHLIRLLRMACEFLETGAMIVRRPDAAELVSIKQGAFSLAHVTELSTALFARAETAFIKSCALPDQPDEKRAEGILLRGYEWWWHPRKGKEEWMRGGTP